MARFGNDRRRHAFLASQREDAWSSAELQAQRYGRGVAGYADYLDAQRNLLNVESLLAVSRRDLALARLAVHRALGGAWADPAEGGEHGAASPAQGGLPPGRPR